MKSKKAARIMKCNDQLIAAEIRKTPGEPDSKILLQHLAECPRCQERISELAAPKQWWDDAAEILTDAPVASTSSNSIVVAVDSNAGTTAETAELQMDRNAGHSVGMSVDEISLNFLESPSHPEMLGRLGRYEIERLIGAGGMGIVLKSFDTELHRVVAIKVLSPHLANSGAARKRFAREAQAAAAVVHDNVIPIYDVETGQQLPYLVMQFVPGVSLQGRVDQNGPLSVDETLRIATQIADGLAAAHQQGLIHRDVKPANILLDQGVDRVLISDFGLARAVDDASLTRSGIVAGTPHYMSPEQARGAGIDRHSDLFGLGSVMYFMCTGHPPFRADGAMAVLNRICHDPHRPVHEVNSDVPLELSRYIDGLLEKDPAKRVSSSHEASQAMDELLTTWRSPGGRRMMSRVQRLSPVAARRGWFAALAICCVAAVFSIYKWWPSENVATTTPRDSVTVNESSFAWSPYRSSGNPPDAISGIGISEQNSIEEFYQELNAIGVALDELESNWNATPYMPRNDWLKSNLEWKQEIESLNEDVRILERLEANSIETKRFEPQEFSNPRNE